MRRLLSIDVKSNLFSARRAGIHRRAFTLVELLVVITIMLILIAVTVASFNYSVNADRVRAAARQVQSFLAGARDKAIYAKEIRGVRLLLDPNDNHAVNAVQYIGSPQREVGTVTIDSTGSIVTWASGSLWYSPVASAVTLSSQGLLRAGCRIQIPANTGTWYTVSYVNGNQVALDRPNRDLAGSSSVQFSFVLELPPSVLGDAQPVALPRGVVIDLDGSNVPSTWRPTSINFPTNPATTSYSTQMDILFTPRGNVVGDCLGLGMLHLHFADLGDVSKWHQLVPGRNNTSFNWRSLPIVPADNVGATTPIVSRDRILTTLATRTGSASVHYVNSTNTVGSSAADDPFSFAESGQVANK